MDSKVDSLNRYNEIKKVGRSGKILLMWHPCPFHVAFAVALLSETISSESNHTTIKETNELRHRNARWRLCLVGCVGRCLIELRE
jgi:hypothetical protein